MDESFLEKSEAMVAAELEAAIHRTRTAPTLQPTGHCLHCDAAIPPHAENQRWCDQDCRDDWEHAQKTRQKVRRC
jgi:predicted nucleic acid-binding Zn ribbon protein